MARVASFVALVLASISLGCLNGDFPTACGQNSAACGGDAKTDSSTDAGSDTTTDTPVDADAVGDGGSLAVLARIEIACARLTACNQGIGAIDFLTCIRSHILTTTGDVSGHPLRASLWTCVDSATSCGDIDACLGGASATGACAGKTTGNYCIGGNVVKCSGAVNVGATVCGLVGQDCLATSASDATCAGKGTCSATSAPTCSTSTQLTHCSGSLDIGSDCSSLGGICGSSSSAGIGCTGADAPCDTGSVMCSDATTASVCRNGHVALIDCGAFLSSCAATAGGDVTDLTRGCAATGGECSAGSAPTCDGTSVRYCLGGHFRLVDCGALGLSPCSSLTTASGPSVACGK